MCGLLLTACVGPPVAGSPSTGALTAANALGVFRTVDYCTLLDTRDVQPDLIAPSFERCVVAVEDVQLVVGPLESGEDLSLTPYDYRDHLPSGVRVEQRWRSDEQGCTLLVGFADGVRLTVAVIGTPEAEEGTHSGATVDWCATADRAVASVLEAIAEKRIGRTNYDQDSFGSLDPCALITGPEFDAVVGADQQVKRTLSGYECVRGNLALSLTIGKPADGTPEILGGRPVVVQVLDSSCALFVERPLPDRPGQVETAQLTGMSIDANGRYDADADVCPVVRAAAALVVPKLPQ